MDTLSSPPNGTASSYYRTGAGQRLVRLALGRLQTVAPGLAARAAARLFRTPCP